MLFLLAAVSVSLPVLDNIYLNGEGPFRFFIDTGAESSVVFQKHANALTIQPEFRVELVSANGAKLVPGAYVEMRVDGRVLPRVEVLLHDLPVRGRDGEIHGVLGQSALRQIDYRLGAQESQGEELPLEYRDGRIGVHTQIEGETYFLTLDSGASHLVLFRKPRKWRTSGRGALSTATETSEVATGVIKQLQVGSLKLWEIPAALTSRSRIRTADGLLPASLFRSVLVSNSRGLVALR